MVPRLLRRLNKSRRVKRLIDIAAASSGLIVLAPLLSATSLVVAGRHGWPPLFVQIRPGKNGELFPIIKFRTMTNERASDGELLPDAQRLTAFGQFLRSSSIDELPELINVLRGQMSLVGPRPLLVQYLPLYNKEQARRHDVPPGITGLAQVRGRNALTWSEKFAYDIEYVDTWSNSQDIRILLATLLALIRPSDVQHEGFATMPFFTGNNMTEESQTSA